MVCVGLAERRGFTLLELLVALAVAAVLLSVVTLRLMPTVQSRLREESRRLAFLMENAALAAQAGGQGLAWSGSGHYYRFWKRGQEGEWLRIEQDPLLRPRTLPESIRIGEVQSDGHRIEPGALVMLSPEVAVRPFRITLVSDGWTVVLSGNTWGEVKIEEGPLP